MAGANRKATRLGDPKFSYVDARTVKNDEILYVGEMISQDATPEALASTDTASTTVLGVGTHYVDNSADGETVIDISTAIHLMDNSSGNPVAKTDIGTVCYVEDACTVAVAAGPTNDIVAGVVVEVTSDGVYVDFDPAKKA